LEENGKFDERDGAIAVFEEYEDVKLVKSQREILGSFGNEDISLRLILTLTLILTLGSFGNEDLMERTLTQKKSEIKRSMKP